MSLIELKNITFRYEKGEEAVLSGFSLRISEGRCVLLRGDNGSGKTTLIRILSGLSFPQEGSYFFKDTRIDELYLRDNRRSKLFHKEVGLLFQNPDTMLFNTTVFDEVAFGPRQMGLSDKEVEERVMDCLKLLGIEDLKDRVPYHLSGGQKKWVALAAVLSLNPEVLILDEPFAGLDRKRGEQLVSLLKELKQAGKTIIMASHEEDLLEGLIDDFMDI